MYKILSSSRDSDDLSIGFYRNIEARERKLTNKKTTKGHYHVRIFLKDVLSFAKHQDKRTCCLGYKLKLQTNSDNLVISHPAAANDAANLALAGSVILDDINLCVPHYTPKISYQKLLLSKMYLELQRNCIY